jgi:SAM-dependent methyltransferase
MQRATRGPREEWARKLTDRARAHWTPERTRELTRGKDLPLVPGEAAVLLRALGLLAMDGSMPPQQVRKYLQVNHLVKLLRPAIAELHSRHGVVRLLDAGCGRSYLTLLLAWCARERWGHRLEVLGVDRNPALIAECERRAAVAELDDVVRFVASPLETVDSGEVHGVFALHACDTATCDAMALGVAARAELIAVAPCCHGELARGWAALAERQSEGAFAPVWRAPHLRRETAAHLTDAMRALLLRSAGYEVTALEFIGSEHTRKNTLLRGNRRGPPDAQARAEYDALVAATGGIGLGLAARL